MSGDRKVNPKWKKKVVLKSPAGTVFKHGWIQAQK